MTLRLKQIRLTNWKCYPSQNITFNLHPDRKIQIIFGNNGYGKTSLMEGILWCLYGGDIVSKETLKTYFYRGKGDSSPAIEMRVELNFTKNDKNYFISRTAKLNVNGSTSYPSVEEALFYEDGTMKGSNSREYIEALLPKSIRDFFCFDGLKIEQYTQITQTKEAKEAIEKVLGIPELRNLRDDAEKALQELENRLNKAEGTSQIFKDKLQQLRELEEAIGIKKDQLKNAKLQEKHEIIIYQDAQEKAAQIESLREKLQEIHNLEKKRIGLETQLNNLQKSIDSWLKKASIPLLINFVQEMVDDLQVTSLKSTYKTNSTAVLKAILDDESCLCGRCLDKNSRDFIFQQIAELELLNVDNYTSIEKDNLRIDLQGIIRDNAKFSNYSQLLLKRDHLEEEIEEINQHIKQLNKETTGINQESANDIWRKVGESGKKVEMIQEKIERLQKEIEIKEKELENLRREVEILARENQTTLMLSNQVKMARGLKNATNELIEWHIDNYQKMINRVTSDRYLQVTNKPEEYRGVEITPEYTLGIRTITGKLLNPDVLSAGEKQALAFAFITGLNQITDTCVPLIMDTPFGHLDKEHQKNIINSLPNLNSQVIILATDRDLPDPLLNLLRPHTADILKINRLAADEDASVIEVMENY
ncbi:MAG: chromosome segregation protein SMC [Microcystis panniformis Mp_MB_F_20051200_S9]|uniref:Nuclease SbcCD subunit C n=1 Tax=Microcystis panniformis Mp_MB_F_20051200_S9 TaxID=2486223 RepID=A0A552Q8B8_9CHRO|nr:MAG: chromosome segregation protein SMC [Microcystis panniformis Mp_GB_SS_20050300_S99D]TRV54762.1 MAG: chromosome segregation protein SMC [Microcystis panniformis Mp_GB_SS_20050300_S99]TRV59418.1 MAG: chromosome segregation protein SMC [Microcystis panniformis Mp_MB_F_20080800_S26]TRV65468.1 MAG: chromosome segregation protein SMC [Microcystis panniformis Mp_MB_F_20051200_S9]TRV67044.1 MAG: chromosome segregation protein SMC [Microcystis panniformis Mp_MB_F_20051200_S6D]TRV69722.1 MAG: chr